MQEKYININGLNIFYRELGNPKLQDVIMIHGWSTTGEVWKDIAKKLSNDFHIIIPDNRGNGKSSIPTSGYHIKDYAKDIYNIIEKLNLKSPIFIGHSWGGNIGTLMGAEYPNLFNLIILEDPVYWKMIDGFKTIIPNIIKQKNMPRIDIIKNGINNGLNNLQAEKTADLPKQYSEEHLKKIAYYNRNWALNCEYYLKKISTPTLIILADPDHGGYISDTEYKYHSKIASKLVDFVKWKNVGHLMHITHPDKFIKEFEKYTSKRLKINRFN